MIEGNYGPSNDASIMNHQIAAYVPNVLAATLKNQNAKAYTIGGNDGTSGSTPQVAAAAALYFQKNLPYLESMPGWQRCEAVRHALFNSADHSDQSIFGRGLLNAAAALGEEVQENLRETPEDSAFFLPLTQLFASQSTHTAYQSMLAVESTQVAHSIGQVEELVKDNSLSSTHWIVGDHKHSVDTLHRVPGISNTLRGFLLPCDLANALAMTSIRFENRMLARREVCLHGFTCAMTSATAVRAVGPTTALAQPKLFRNVATEICGHPKFT
jgi:hypothetical protein